LKVELMNRKGMVALLGYKRRRKMKRKKEEK
jgi:hypothetical protein